MKNDILHIAQPTNLISAKDRRELSHYLVRLKTVCIAVEKPSVTKFGYCNSQRLKPLVSQRRERHCLRSFAEVLAGIAVGEMQKQMMQKIEELTLYVIQLKKENDAIKQELHTIKQGE